MVEEECAWFDEYLDGCLTGDEREAFELHASACATCSELLLIHGKLDCALRAYADSLASRIQINVPVELPARNYRQSVLACAVIVAFLLLGMLALRKSETVQPIERVASQPIKNPGLEHAMVVDESEYPSAPEVPPLPLIRSMDAADYLIVVEPPSDDELTVVMLYPKLSSN